MAKRLIGASALVLAACATASAPATVAPLTPLASAGEVTAETLLALNAMCRAEDRMSAPQKVDLKLGGKVGTGGFPVDSDSAEAQAWFNYGFALSHAFYHLDAVAALKKAVAADPACALCAWGEAWVLGPTLNYGLQDAERLLALAAAERAKSLADPDNTLEVALTDAMLARYQKSEDSTEPAFGRAMKAIAEAHPDNLELAVLAAHALMIPVRADDDSGLEPALAMLEGVLTKRPDDTGAIHYYIHGTEFARRAADALPYAKKLGDLAPDASHLVHMPAHTYFRVGLYYDAAQANAAAIDADTAWLETGGDAAFPPSLLSFVEAPPRPVPLYYGHNLAFGLAGALMAGDAELALRYAEHSGAIFTDDMPEWSRVYTVSRGYVALARHAPDAALAIPEPAEPNAAMTVYRHYARGEALILRGDLAGAQREAKAIRAVKDAKDDPEAVIARHVLEGRIALAQGRFAAAVRQFEAAAEVQESDLAESWDPPDWWYPVRRSLAAAHLKAGDFATAEAEARASLAGWPHDPLALWVLGEALGGQGRTADAAKAMDEARKTWRGDFSSITAEAI